jgi:catechol 2,3-dioxygenase-like lactoylglutathione lyase family enzyme
LHHAAIVVPSLEEAIEFYIATLGYTLVKTANWEGDRNPLARLTNIESLSGASALLRLDLTCLEIFSFKTFIPSPQASLPTVAGIRHLAFEVPDLSSSLKSFLHHGGRQIGDVLRVPGGGAACYCTDPFGNIIELLEPGGSMPSMRADISGNDE